MNTRTTLADWLMAPAVAIGLLALCAAIDQREEEMLTHVTAPATEADMLTPAGLAEWRATHECCTGGCNQGRDCPLRWQPAEAATDIGAEPRGKHRTGLLAGLWLRLSRVLG